MTRFLLICIGGAFGTGARYLLTLWIARTAGPGFPYGTLLVNIAGSFLLGLLMQLPIVMPVIRADARLIIGTGVLGGFTTYSTFNYETLWLMREASWGMALVNVTATFLGCLAAGVLGIAVGRGIAH